MRPALTILLLPLLAACDEEMPRTPVERGRQVYRLVCLSCHGLDPRQDGTQGPAIAGSSRELLAARVLRAEYPPGYRPKRDTGNMAAFPYLADRIDDLFAYLQAAAQPALEDR